ncbi:MAG: hypothetical protein ABSF18_07720 [Gammaproteobacteria bacterium]|jgi:hypothetical protein
MPKGTPTYLVLNPNGTVTALFSGGVELNEYQGAVVIPSLFDQLTFIDPSGNEQEAIYGQLAGGGGLTHYLFLQSGIGVDPGPGGSYAYVQLGNTPGVSGASGIYVACSDNVNNITYIATILNSLGFSSFMWAMGAPTQPARTWATPYQPNTLRDTLVMVTAGAAAGTQWSVYVGPTSTPALHVAIAGGAGNPGIWDTVTFGVPAGYYYKLTQDVGAPPIALVTETTL